jgi:hypothetical protein
MDIRNVVGIVEKYHNDTERLINDLMDRLAELEGKVDSPNAIPDNGGFYNKLDFLRLLVEVSKEINVQDLLEDATNKLHSQLFKEEK